MTKKSAKTLALLLAVIMILACFSGCGNKTAVEKNGSPVTLNGDKIYPMQCDDTLTFWFTGTSIWNQNYENFGETPLGKEIAKKTGVNIEYVHPTGTGTEQFQILIASDDLPDIVNHAWYSFTGGPDEAINQEYIYELSDIIDEYCPSLKALFKENPSWASQIKTDSNNFYAFPYIRGTDPITKVVWGPIIRNDWLSELNLASPVTIEDWEEVLTAFKDKKGAIPFGGNASAMCYTFYPAFGGTTGWYRDGNTVKYGEAQPQYKEFLKKMNEWYQKGLIDEDFAVVDSTTFNSNVLNGKIGAFTGYVGSGIGTMLQAGEKVSGGFDITGAQYPVMNAGDVNAEYSRFNSEVDVTGTSTAISKNCKNVELAARFLDWGYSQEGNEIYNFGIEGESFNWVDKNGEKYPQYSDLVFDNPDGMSVSDVLHMYTRAAQSNVPMVLDARYSVQYYSMPQQIKAQEEWAKTNMSEHLMPAIYILGSDSDTDADIMAAVKTYIDEMTIKFITGRESLDKFDEYLQQIDKFGFQTSVGFRQEALKRYNSR